MALPKQGEENFNSLELVFDTPPTDVAGIPHRVARSIGVEVVVVVGERKKVDRIPARL
jgi:hypothetical protein